MQAEGHINEAACDIVDYVRGGFSALQYGTINYLPCYAAAGLLIKLGIFNNTGQVWSSHVLDAIASAQRCSSPTFCHHSNTSIMVVMRNGCDDMCTSVLDARLQRSVLLDHN